MKFIIYYILFAFLVPACQDETEGNTIISKANDIIALYIGKSDFVCSSVDDVIYYPKPWTTTVADTFTIAETKLKNTSTCGLIQTYFNQPWNILGPWCSTCSDLSLDGVQYYNDRVNQDAVVSELFLREDAINKLMGTYIEVIQDLTSMEKNPGYLYSYELLLAGENMNKILTDSLSKELMLLALKMIDVKKDYIEFNSKNSLAITRHILANVLFQKQYEPFLSACTVDGSLEIFTSGYKVCYDGDKVESYAEMYLLNN